MYNGGNGGKSFKFSSQGSRRMTYPSKHLRKEAWLPFVHVCGEALTGRAKARVKKSYKIGIDVTCLRTGSSGR